MTTEQDGFAVVNISTSEIVRTGSALPIKAPPPGKPKGAIIFNGLGHEIAGLKCVEAHRVTQPSSHHKRGNQTKTFDGTKVVVDPNWTLPNLDATKAKLMARVGERAEAIRQQYITPGDGKSLSYREGYEEAVEVLADPDAALALVNNAPVNDPHFANACDESFPVLYPDIGKGGTTDIVGIATLVATTFEAFQKIENALKKAINPALTAIQGATTVAQAQAAFDAIQWPEF